MAASGVSALGSRRDFDYYDDSGAKWAIRLDESNTLLINPSGDVGAATATNRIPRGTRPRYVEVIDATGTVRRKCCALKLATYTGIGVTSNWTLPATDSNADTVVAPTLKTPEKVRNLIKNFDTGLTDGTNP